MKEPEWCNKVFIGGGFLRSVISGDPVNDVDVFVSSAELAESLAIELACRSLYRKGRNEVSEEEYKAAGRRVHKTDNDYTLTCTTPVIQIIHRWTFGKLSDVADSFDFTCCCAAFAWDLATENWYSYCDERFYADVAAKRLIYRQPVRNEDAGGSMLRVLKYYQKGYRIPVDSLGAVIARLMSAYCPSRKEFEAGKINEEFCAKVVTGLLREVDPSIDPKHVAHLPAEEIPSRAAIPETGVAQNVG